MAEERPPAPGDSLDWLFEETPEKKKPGRKPKPGKVAGGKYHPAGVDPNNLPPKNRTVKSPGVDRGPNLVPLPKSSPKKEERPARPEVKKLAIPASLLSRRVKASHLTSGAFQKKLMSGVAVELSAEALQGLYAALQDGNLAAIKMTLEAVGILTPKSAVSIVNNNNVDNRQLNVGAPAESENPGRRSFEQIARMLKSEQEQRQQLGAPSGLILEAQFEPTPPRGQEPAGEQG